MERVAVRAVAEREGVVDGQGGEPDGGGSGGAAHQTGFVQFPLLRLFVTHKET